MVFLLLFFGGEIHETFCSSYMEHTFVIPPYLRSLVCIVYEDRSRADTYWFVRINNMYLSELCSTISIFHIYLVCYKIKIFINFIGIIKYQFHVMHDINRDLFVSYFCVCKINSHSPLTTYLSLIDWLF